MEDKSNVITIARIKSPEPQVVRLVQPGSVPPRPKWMEGEPGYVQRVYTSCPTCHSNNVWRGLWAHFTEAYYVLEKMKPPVRHSGRKRNAACLSCGEFWNDIQAVQYNAQDEGDVWWDDIEEAED